MSTQENFSSTVSFIWSVADLLRGDYKAHQYGSMILPFVVLRRLDQAIEATRDDVTKAYETGKNRPRPILEKTLLKASKMSFFNISPQATSRKEGEEGKTVLEKITEDPANIADQLISYIEGFCIDPSQAEIDDMDAEVTITRIFLKHFKFRDKVSDLNQADLLYQIVKKFTQVDMSLETVSNHDMGYIFEELIRKFSEQANETAGEHFTPREVIKMMVNLLTAEDGEGLSKGHQIRSIYDPACGTGGMISIAEKYLLNLNPDISLQLYGQELNPESYATCASDMLIKGQDVKRIKLGNSFSQDQHPTSTFSYMLSNPPFGVDWSKVEKKVRDEHETLGFNGRFGPGLPRKSDGSLLFVLHMLSKMKSPEEGGSRIAVVLNGSPLFSGAAGSGESEIRRYLLENDLLEAIVALPDQMFYNTGISTYIWVISNKKPDHRKGKIQLINGVNYFQKMRKSLGDKRKELSDEHIDQLTKLYANFEESDEVKIFDNNAFGFHRVTVERPLKLNFQISEERLARLDDQSAWKKLVTSKKKDKQKQAKEIEEGRVFQTQILEILRSLDGSLFINRASFVKLLKAGFKKAGVKVPAPVFKAILSALSEPDENAEDCIYESGANKGNTEPDSSLRDYENIPLTEEIYEYMAREVLPHVSDAWVDESKTKVGYEIPFTRHFYVYEPPRPLAVIESEIRSLEDDLRGLLAEVFR